MSSHRINICIITKEFPPWNIGGIATWAEALAVRFQEYDSSRVTVLVKGRGIDENLVSPHSRIRFIFMGGHSWKKYHFFYTYYYLRKYLRQHSNAIVIASNWKMAKAAVKLKSRYHPIIVTAAHGMEITRLPFLDQSERKKMEEVIHRSDVVISVSNYTNVQIHKLCKSRPTNTHVLHNGTDIEYFRPTDERQKERLKETYNFDKNSLILLTLARVIPRKGHDIVIRALPKVIGVIPNLIYVIAGHEHSNWKIELNTLISKLGLEDHLRFFGAVTGQKKLEMYQVCDAYIMVSKSGEDTGDTEGFPITFLEANACGKPVIGSDTGGIPDAVEDSVSGLLVDPDNVDQTADAIIRLMSDYAYRTLLGEQALARVKNQFTWDHVAAKIWRLLDR